MILYRPLGQWPEQFTADRKPARLSAPWWEDTVVLLDREVAMLTDTPHLDPIVVVELALAPKHFTRDDGLRSGHPRPEHPGVIVSFDSIHGPLRYSTDRHTDGTVWRGGSSTKVEGWRANVRAVALSLEALRLVDLYGVGGRGEQYRGWNALGAGTEMGGTTYEAEGLARFIGTAAGWDTPPDPTDPEQIRAAYTKAALRHHPDTGGTPEMMTYLNTARDALLKERGR